MDTIVGGERMISLKVLHQRDVNRLEVFTNETPILKAVANGIDLSPYFLENRRGGRLLTHYVSDNDPTELQLYFPEGQPLELTLYEASNDLLRNPHFSVPARPENHMPMPFVLNDAVLLIKKVRFE